MSSFHPLSRRTFLVSRGMGLGAALPSLLALLLLPAAARANFGTIWSGGQVVAEPVGIIDVAITRETLTIDLRPLATNSPAQVEAIYHLSNDGPEKKLDLLFASGSATVSDFHVWFAGQPVDTHPAPDVKMPDSWKAPRYTPWLYDAAAVSHVQQQPLCPVAMTLVVPPGRHELKVRYAAEATVNHFGHPTFLHQFAYVLAPARAWSGFGGLDVTIHLPANWRAGCSPEMAREGDTLRGSFDNLPGDAIALTVQAPEGWAYWSMTYFSWGLLGVVGLGGLAACLKGSQLRGRSLAHTKQPPGVTHYSRAVDSSITFAALWSASVFGASLLVLFVPDWLLPRGQANPANDFESVLTHLGIFVLGFLAIPVGFSIAQVTTCVVHDRERLAQYERRSTAPVSNPVTQSVTDTRP